MTVAAPTVADRKVTVLEIVRLLVADRLAAPELAEQVAAERRAPAGHALVNIAARKWRAPETGRTLELPFLAEWFAGKCGLQYFHIDPLRINFAGLTDIMSSAYAERFKILPVERTPRELVIATAEPYVLEWERELRQVLRVEIRRVFANPVDLERYLVEFYTLARSIKRAAASGSGAGGLANFEQLVDLGQATRQFDANDQHIVGIVDWL